MMNGEYAATDAVAGAAIVSPLWLPWLHTASAGFAELIPILGGIWLFVQITRALIQGWIALSNWMASKKTRPKL